MTSRHLFIPTLGVAVSVWFAAASPTLAQQVTLPLPRLLTVMPMGAQAGGSVEVTITGENLEDVTSLQFSSPQITARPVTGADGTPVPNKFLVSVAPGTPAGVHDARVLSRLGISSVRAFAVSNLKEITRTAANNTVESAMALELNSICNASMTRRAVDHYAFQAKQGQPIVVDCAAAGIDSRLTPVVVIADAQGRDLLVNRTGGRLNFTPPTDGRYLIKLNDLTFQGGERYFYRLALQTTSGQAPLPRQPETQTVSAMSWPPAGLTATPANRETEPNNRAPEAQKVSLPCDIGGSFYPAADVDTYEFAAKKGETWWVEVASERLGRDTDPFVLVQQVKQAEGKETLTDVAELYDIASPMKLSSNGYAYDGPPYNAGSPDVNGKFEVKEDGIYRLQLRDLFGGTRSDPNNEYRLLVRKAAPDFSLAAWGVHMTLRNGDRAALSKPMALRAGESRVFEVVTQRRDGFDGAIELAMEGLPTGVTATGLKIGAGKSYGHLILTAANDAAAGISLASITGKAVINGQETLRPCRMATMKWPVKDAKGEIPAPRLMADVPVSVSNSEPAPLTIEPADSKVVEATVGTTVTIPLKITWRNEFTGTSLKLKAYGDGFAGVKEIDIPMKAETTTLTLDLAALKLPAGEHALALYGTAVSKYRYNPAAVPLAEAEQKKAELLAQAAAEEAKKIAATDAAAAKAAAAKAQQAGALMAEATKRMKTASTTAEPRDTVDIIVSSPIRLSVKPAPVASAATTSSKP
jgi:hypothetical protein